MNNKIDSSRKTKRIVISLGDPAGIGTEITLKALGSKKLPSEIEPLLIGCQKYIEEVYSSLKEQGVNSLANPANLEIDNLPINHNVTPGKTNAKNGEASFHWLTHATNLMLKGAARGLVTAPISKESWHKAGHIYPGQTERLAEIASISNPSMMFTAISPYTGWRFNTLLATTHIPLAKVIDTLTPNLVEAKLNTLLGFCKQFKSDPQLIIAGLNPHAGENGQLGLEEVQWLKPLIKRWHTKNASVDIKGPMPPDTCWLSAAKSWRETSNTQSPDGFLALYHDQGLIPTKLLAFHEAVNTTLGLPFVRTSPDHGTAFDIAGKGCAQEKSMISAIKASWELSKNK